MQQMLGARVLPLGCLPSIRGGMYVIAAWFVYTGIQTFRSGHLAHAADHGSWALRPALHSLGPAGLPNRCNKHGPLLFLSTSCLSVACTQLHVSKHTECIAETWSHSHRISLKRLWVCPSLDVFVLYSQHGLKCEQTTDGQNYAGPSPLTENWVFRQARCRGPLGSSTAADVCRRARGAGHAGLWWIISAGRCLLLLGVRGHGRLHCLRRGCHPWQIRKRKWAFHPHVMLLHR